MAVFFCPLPQETLLHLHGNNVSLFLQGQTTCDVRQANANVALGGAHCNAQGRVLADFLLLAPASDHILLRLRQSIAIPSMANLAKYAAFSRVKVEQAEDWQVYACWGEDAANTLAELTQITWPQDRYRMHTGHGYYLLQLDDQGCEFELYLHREQGSAVLQALSRQCLPTSADDWQQKEQARGIARIEPSTIATFLPQALSYDLAGLISFNKGCYTGQEVIARLHYRGKSKRRLFGATTQTTSTPVAGDTLYTNSDKQAAGTVVNVVATDKEQWQLLLSLATQAALEEVHLYNTDGPLLQLSEPPFGIH
ncbi:MAG: YgfZ/GcvT domain-containing protein [Parahaliea sp.]